MEFRETLLAAQRNQQQKSSVSFDTYFATYYANFIQCQMISLKDNISFYISCILFLLSFLSKFRFLYTLWNDNNCPFT